MLEIRSSFFLWSLLATLAPAQNAIPGGDFETNAPTWSLVSFNDPAGSTGFGPAAVVGQGPSFAVNGMFRTVGNGVRSALYRSAPFAVLASGLPIGFSAMWEKQVTPPIPSPTVNRVELRILDLNLANVQTFRLQAPNQTGLIERASFQDFLNVPPGTYIADIFIRYSNLAGIPFDCWVDDVYLGEPAVRFSGQGCAGTNGIVPKLHTDDSPLVGNLNFRIGLHGGLPNSIALCLLGLSDTGWSGGALPFALGGGCDLRVEPLFALPQLIVGTNPGDGRASQQLGIPNRPALTGALLHTQWLMFDPAATNPFGVVSTSGMAIRVQN